MKITNEILRKIMDNPDEYARKIQIKELVKILQGLADAYFNTNEPLVPDRVYDMLRDVLEERDPEHEYLAEIGSKRENDTQLPFPMSSLDKIKPDTGVLERWIKKYPGPYTLSDKLDGMSAMIYNDGKTTKMFTRGDATFGKDISNLVKQILKKATVPKNTAVRGELIISKKDFKKIADKYKNVRNTITTLRTDKNPKKEILEISKFVAYSIVYPRYKQEEQMKILSDTKLEVVNNTTIDNLNAEYLSKLLEKRRTESEYDVDGIVVVDSSKIYNVTEEKPDHAFAFKKVLSDQIIESEVVGVEWNESKYGYLKPRVKIKPVSVGGATITYATGHNAKFIVDGKIGPGAILKIVRSGDVIPKIMTVIKPSADGKPQMPKIPYKWNTTKVDIVLNDIHGDQKNNVIVRRLQHFFKTINIKHIDEGFLKLIVDSGRTTVFDILSMTSDNFDSIPGLGIKTYRKIMKDTYDKLESVNIETLMSASLCFDRGIGVKKLKMALATIPDLLTKNYTEKKIIEQLNSTKGFEQKTSELIASGVKSFRIFKKKLGELYDLSHLDKDDKKIVDDSMKDFVVVFTGVRDKDTEKFIENRNGKVSTTISGNTTHLVYKQISDSGKFKKAKVLGVKMMTLDAFKQKYVNKN